MGVAAIIELIGTLVPVINNLVGYANRLIERLHQDTEMTQEQFSKLKATVETVDTINPGAWLTDAERAAMGTKPQD